MSQFDPKTAIGTNRIAEETRNQISNVEYQAPARPQGFSLPPELLQECEPDEGEQEVKEAKAKRKKPNGKKMPVEMKNGRVTFNQPISWDLKKESTLIKSANFFFFKDQHKAFVDLLYEDGLTLLEGFHILVADAIEKGTLPPEMKERYLDVRENS